MATLTENINSVKTAFENIKSAIEQKGVTVAPATPVTEYGALIGGISGGSGVIDAASDYSYMFYKNCRVDILNESLLGDTSHVTDFRYFAQDSTSLTSVPEMDLSSALCTARMFSGCTNVSSFQSYMNLTSLTGNRAGEYMFYNLGKNAYSGELTVALPQSLHAGFLFYGASFSAVHIITPTKITYANSMFRAMPNLRTVTGLDLSESTDLTYMFEGSTALENLELVGTIPSYNLDLSKQTLLSHVSLMNVINALCQNSTAKLTLGETNLAKITDDEKAIATNKGWTLA